MEIKFKYGGVSFTADTPQAVDETLALLRERDAKSARERVMLRMQGTVGEFEAHIRDLADTPWTPEVFLSFVDRLGDAQKVALAVLVTRRRVTDEELRKALKVSGNQALAGVLSGISKQAAALNIPARAHLWV